MDLDKITLNECSNDGTKIYLYYSPEMDKWVTFGNSAFILAALAKKEHIDYVTNFSVMMQMPSMVINKTELDKIVSTYEAIIVNNEQYLITLNSNHIDAEEYGTWAAALRDK